MRRSALIAATLAVLSGCGGETKTKATPPERAKAADWRPSAEQACERATSALVSRAWFMDLKEMRRRLPSTVRDVRSAIEQTSRLPGRPDQRFVSDMGALDAPLADLARASRAMHVDRLDRVITRLEGQLGTLAASAQRTGLKQCVGHAQSRRVTNALRAPVAAERVARIVRTANRRTRAAHQDHSINGLRDAVDAWRDQDVAVRKLKVPTWAERARTGWRAAARRYSRGLDELGDRYEAGLGTPDAMYDELITRPFRQSNRMLHRLYDRIGAHSLGD